MAKRPISPAQLLQARPAAVWRWALEPPALPAELILRLQKYRDMARVPRAIREAAEAVAAEAIRLTRAEAVLWCGPVSRVDPSGAVTLADVGIGCPRGPGAPVATGWGLAALAAGLTGLGLAAMRRRAH